MLYTLGVEQYALKLISKARQFYRQEARTRRSRFLVLSLIPGQTDPLPYFNTESIHLWYDTGVRD
jgi:hypothetical protein